MNLLPGRQFEIVQETASSGDEERGGEANASSIKKPLCLVYFLGGVTFSEISALRHLSERPNHGCDYLVASTKLVNGASLMGTLIEDIENLLDPKTVK